MITSVDRQMSQGIVTTTVARLKDLARSKEARMLLKHGFEDENGNPTKSARQFVVRQWAEDQWKGTRKALAADLIKVDELDLKRKNDETVE